MVVEECAATLLIAISTLSGSMATPLLLLLLPISGSIVHKCIKAVSMAHVYHILWYG